jgi:hypothetical protein
MEPKRTEKPLSERFSGFSVDQWRFIAARLNTTTDKEAAEEIGLNDKTPSKWPNKSLINDAIAELRIEAAAGAVEALKQSSLKAAMVIAGLLDSDDEPVRLRAAQDILDRVNGKPTQRQEITGADGESLSVRLDWGDNANA